MLEAKLQQLWIKYRVPDHIQSHMKAVAAVALYLGQKMVQNGTLIDLVLVRQAALLHDIVKLTDFKKVDTKYFTTIPSHDDLDFLHGLINQYGHLRHVEAGYQVLLAEKEFQIAAIVRKHGLHTILDLKNPLESWEEKLVYYADKRVRHHEIVSLQDRLDDLRNRYSDKHLFSEIQLETKLFQLEHELCQKAGIKPEHINTSSVQDFLEA